MKDNLVAQESFKQFEEQWQNNAQLALAALALRQTKGIPSWLLNPMQWSHLEKFSGNPPGSYKKDPIKVYLDFQLKTGVCFNDQWIPENPLSMKDQGYDNEKQRGATTGLKEIIMNDMLIDSPEAVVEHMEKLMFPAWRNYKANVAKNSEKM